ncbi:dihydropteroate synthase [Flagellimonas sp. DF-77]|uniref:dihydropteroate synthase n=1 Tax=Flagellimonas algarum TaxID=3230298 RepID=UPI0033955081
MTINCNGLLIDLSTPKVMGIVNVTPDSFYDGGRLKDALDVLRQVETMLNEGATFIDVGGYSSRPNAQEVSIAEELRRVLPITEALYREFPGILLSIDTFRSTVAEAVLEAGAAMINDISAGHLDPGMLETIAAHQVPYIMMHMRGTPQTMQQQTDYGDLEQDIIHYFSERLRKIEALKINDVILDPGFGFSKTTAQNFQLLNHFDVFQHLGRPLLVGLSRKSMIYKTLDIASEHALNGTTALHMIALTKGASILRAHDVKEAMECVRLHACLVPPHDPEH